MRYLLDTNILSEVRKGRGGNAGVQSWAAAEDQASFAISVITIKEIEYGILNRMRHDPEQSMLFRLWLDHHVLPTYSDRILDIDLAVAQKAAALDVPDPTDGLIAATALVHDLTVVTRNVRHFASMGVRLLNPFN
ncbi:MAG: type II toxin-antitoxin system VapC family toxin [Devosia sp.]